MKPEAVSPALRWFHVSARYMTASGNFGGFHSPIQAVDEGDAMERVSSIIKADRRRRYLGKLDMSASAYSSRDEPSR